MQDGRTLQDSSWHKFTLGLSNVMVPELTTEVMMSNTELYAQPQASVSELRDADGGVTEPQTKRGDEGDGDRDDVREELQDITQDQPNMCEGNVSKPHPDPSEDPELDSQHQEEDNEVEMMPASQENESVCLSPEDILLAPTQPMGDHVSHPQEHEASESAIWEAQMEEPSRIESESRQEEEPSHVLQRVTRRAYHSEGGAIRSDVMARSRGTKSLGMRQDPTEKHEQSSEGKMRRCCAFKSFSIYYSIKITFNANTIVLTNV